MTYDLAENRPISDNKNILLVKIHARNRFVARIKAYLVLPPHNFTGKYIYTYRDPRDAIISLYEMYKKLKGVADLSPENFIKIYDPIGQYRWEINSWIFRKNNNVFLVRFEDLKANPLLEYKKIFDFLRIEVSVATEAISQFVSTSDSKKRPRGTAGGWKDAPDEYKWLIDEVTKKLDKEIRQIGYEHE